MDIENKDVSQVNSVSGKTKINKLINESISRKEKTVSVELANLIKTSSLEDLKIENFGSFDIKDNDNTNDPDLKEEILYQVEKSIKNSPYVFKIEKFNTLLGDVFNGDSDSSDNGSSNADTAVENFSEDIGISIDEIECGMDLREIRKLILDKITKIRLSLSRAPRINQCIIGNTVVDIPEINFVVKKNVKTNLKAAGVGDLLVVKKELLKFKKGEIAHIENIIKSEKKERSHRVFRSMSETISSQSSTERESLKDTQSNEQFSIQKETNDILNKQKSTDKSINASAKYGNGFVSASINAGYASSNSSQQTQANRSASSYAKGITERALDRVITQISESRTRTRKSEVEEINTHGFDNTKGTGNISGVYYYLDKFYEVKIFNYGKRIMYQLIVDKPASNYMESIASNPIMGIEMPIHPAKMENKYADIDGDGISDFGDESELSGGLKTFDDITKENYKYWTALYGIKEVEHYPENQIIFDTLKGEPDVDKDNNQIGNSYKAHKMIQIPEDYVPVEASYSNIGYSSYRKIRIGSEITGFSLWLQDGDSRVIDNKFYKSSEENIITGTTKELPIIISCSERFIINISIVCIPSEKAIENWKLKIYNSIIEVYENDLREYNQKVSQLTSNGDDYGNNPAINRQIEKEEIRKACIESILDKTFNFSAIKKDKGEYNRCIPPEKILLEIQSNENYYKILAFMEEAFEWDQMTYEYFPYYWNKERKEMEKLKSNDLLFQSFLRASTAKAILAVRPGFERPMMHFLNEGKLWTGGKELFSITKADADLIREIDEASEQSLKTPIEIGEPWELKVPTSLVILDVDEENSSIG